VVVSAGSLHGNRQEVVVELRGLRGDRRLEDQRTPVELDGDLAQVPRQSSLEGPLLSLRARGDHVTNGERTQVPDGEEELASLRTMEGDELVVCGTVRSGGDRRAGRIGAEGERLADLDFDSRARRVAI